MTQESDSQRIARQAGVADDHPWLAGCGCWTCTSERVTATDGHGFFMPMCVCADCGNKRCPRATHHDNACSGSNEPGQDGSRYAHMPIPGTETALGATQTPSRVSPVIREGEGA